MGEYYGFLSAMTRGEPSTITYLQKFSSQEQINKALKEGFIRETTPSDLGIPRFLLTQKGFDYRNSGQNRK